MTEAPHPAARPMRILEVCTSFRPGGIQRHVLDLTAWLRARGHHVVLAGAPGRWLDASRDASFLPLDLHLVGSEGGSVLRRLGHAARAARRLRAFVAAEDIEVVHAHESAPLLVAALATPGLSAARLVTYHGSEPDRVRSFARLARFGARRVLSPSVRTAEALASAGVPRARLDVIGLGIDPGSVVDGVAVQALRAELLGGRRKLVLTVARLAPQKGIDLLLEMVRRLGPADALQFVIVGDGPSRAALQAQATRLGVERHVTFVGHRDDVPRYLAAADVFLLSSRWEALPITIVEAFRAGVPVIATDAGGVRELVDDTVGRVVPIGDVDALGAALRALCDDDALRLQLGAAARQRGAEQRFDRAFNHARIEAAYTALCHGPEA